ncbi:MAG: hypothetical protein IJN68_03935 [Clostridia bacterium]|nr:hypothetical protein [Oscillospiraceae bacterium]MBQ7005560.1 hypothetical protein [Clostridia bacterium]
MIRLFTLDDISAFSSDTIYKIGLAAEKYGLSDDAIASFPTHDTLYNETLLATENGDYVIVACETEDYNSTKRELIAKLLLEEYESEEITDLIALNAGDDISEIDVTGHSLVPRGSVYHFTTDGLYCGFTTDVLHGKLTFLPLDFMRIDAVLTSLVEDILAPMAAIAKGERPPIKMPDEDILPVTQNIVDSLQKADMKLALATGEATMWVYNLYDKIENLTDNINFVEVIDEEPDRPEDATAETESVRIIRHAREAMLNSGAALGGAISEIYSTENEDGKTVYFAYAAIVDKGSAKAKKINTSNPEDLSAILPHALTVLSGLVEAKAEQTIRNLEIAQQRRESEEAAAYNPYQNNQPQPAKPEEKLMSKNMLIAGIIAVAFAIIIPILIVVGMATREEPTDPYQSVLNPGLQSTVNGIPTQNNPQNNTSLPPVGNNVTEPSALDVSAAPTVAPAPSTSGTFTFYVFGYGHGVGMSQNGANYLASLGWSWADILAHYYYDANTSIVFGEVYPQKITYMGNQYDTREYLARALEAEMSPSFNREALKAQVVAIYTFARYYNNDSLAVQSPIFSTNLQSSAHAFLDASKTPSAASYAAVDEIMAIGPYVAYNGGTALTTYHAMSAGKTTSYYNTWGKGSNTAIPYLNGARDSRGDYESADFKSTVTLSSSDIQALAAQQGITLSGDPATWISIINHDAAIQSDIGYVSSIRVGNKTMSGYEFRTTLLGSRLRSHCFAMTYTPGT